jgi:acetylornithine/N-succinyldiaminopimelate aminotransferase
MAVGLAVIEELAKPEFLAHVVEAANQLGQGLESLKDRHPDLVVETRGKGLLRGVKLTIDPKIVQAHARTHKLLVGVAGDNVLRLAPPLTVDAGLISEAITALDAALADARAKAA